MEQQDGILVLKELIRSSDGGRQHIHRNIEGTGTGFSH